MSALLKQRLLGQPGGCHTTPPTGVRSPPRGDNTPFTSTKGLLNGPGQNNCFLNSAVQVLWHLDVFRRSFRELSGHACMAEACIFCALKELFGQLQFSQESALPPDALRRALAESFFDQQRFQLGFMDDAAECFENILLRIHYHIANGEAEDMCAARHCIPHQKFAMTLVEQSVCEACHVTSEPLSYTQMVHYVSASALTAQARATAKTSQPDLFGQLLRKAGGMGDIRDCPSSCGAKIQICRALMNRPEVVSVGVVWDSERPTLEHIMSVFATVGTTLRLSDVFHSVVDHRWAAATTHSLVGVVTYYGKHYSTFFFHTKLRLWIYFDDANVREIGPRFEQVVEKCRRGRYQPLLLLYAVQGGTPVSTEGAPKTVVPISVTPRRGKPTSQIPLRRSVTPSPEKVAGVPSQRRAVTPNPDRYADYQNLADIQAAIFPAEEPGYISRQAVESVMSAQNALSRNNSLYEPKRNGPSVDGIAVPDHLNVPRRRDSGNWSGDRNSASSSSSLENPYLCLVGRMRPVPRSPKPSVGDCGGVMDPGYDSYSLSSNDSLPLQQQLKHNLQLAQIPEHSAGADDCERLCVESDRLLGKARQLEAACDFETALVVSRAAGDKARRAMDAPYNNPRALSLARMKHNACVMHARSLARRMDETALDIRHSRENSGSSNRSASHSRQSSRDKTQSKPQHSRQSSRELVLPPAVEERKPPPKSIEIYATLPRKKLGSPRAKPIETEEDAEYMYERPGRSLQSRVGLRKDEKKDKRAKSEERKSPRDYSLLNTSSTLPKDSPKKDKEKEKERAKEEKRLKEEAKKNEAKAGKKQHKIRRKLLMGGLIRRKNRSMPDLREGQDAVDAKPVEVIAPTKLSQDDAALPDKSDKSMSGYLSEGHLEYGRTNPNLERSRLMRKTSHGAKGRLPPKVPPLPPLRTSSQLTAMDEPRITYEPVTYANGGILGLLDPRFAGFEARTESTQSLALPPYPSPLGSANHSRQPSEEFPPPPPPLDEEAPVKETSTLLAQLQIKRQQILEKDASPRSEPAPTPPPSTQSTGETWLRELQAKQAERRRRQPPAAPAALAAAPDADVASVRDLASRFESAKAEKTENYSRGVADAYYPTSLESSSHAKNMIDSEKYYQPPVENVQVRSHLETTSYHKDIEVNGYPRSSLENGSYSHGAADPANYVQKTDNGYPRVPEIQPKATAIQDVTGYARESPKTADLGVEYLSLSRDAPERVSHHPSPMTNHTSQLRDVADGPRRTKKKNVTFCDEVILVATADDEEDDPFIPNPILERVLRSAFRPAQAEVRIVPGAGTLAQGQHQVTAQMHQVPASVLQGATQGQQMPSQNQAPLPNHQVPIQSHQLGLPNHQVPPPSHQGALQNHQSGLPNHQVPVQNHQPALQNHQSGLPNHQVLPPNHQALIHNHQPVSPHQPALLQPQYSASQQQQVSYQMQQASSQSQQVPPSSASQYRDFQPHPTSAGQSQATYPHVYQQIPSNSAKYQQFVANNQTQDSQQGSGVNNQQVPNLVQSPNGVQQYQHVPTNSQQYQQNQIPRYQHLPNQQRMGQRLHQQSPTYGQQQFQHVQPTNYPSQNASTGIPQYQQSASQIPTPQPYQHSTTNGGQQVPSGQPQYYQQLPASKLQQPVYQRVPLSIPNGGGLPNGVHPPYQHPPPPRQQAGTRPGYQQSSESSIVRPVYQSVPENAAVRVQAGDSQARPAYLPASENGVARPVYQQDNVQSRVMYQANQDSGQNRVVYQPNQDGAQNRLYQQNGDGLQNRSAGQLVQDNTQQPRPYQNHDSGQPRPAYGQVPETGQPVAKAGPCHLCRKKPVATPAIYCTDCHFYMSRFKPRA